MPSGGGPAALRLARAPDESIKGPGANRVISLTSASPVPGTGAKDLNWRASAAPAFFAKT
jgi:hypothetical protein